MPSPAALAGGRARQLLDPRYGSDGALVPDRRAEALRAAGFPLQ